MSPMFLDKMSGMMFVILGWFLLRCFEPWTNIHCPHDVRLKAEQSFGLVSLELLAVCRNQMEGFPG